MSNTSTVLAFHANIRIPVKFIEPDYKLTPEVLRFHNNTIPRSMINDQIHQWLESVGLYVDDKWSRYFHSFPNQRYGIHADSKMSYVPRTKLNVVFDSYGTEMVWYRYNPTRSRRSIILTEYDAPLPLGDKYNKNVIRNYEEQDCEEICRTITDTSCLIDASKIHTLINSDNQGKQRRCYSLTLAKVEDKQLITFDEAAVRLKDYIC